MSALSETTKETIDRVFISQARFFDSGKTKSLEFRKKSLLKMKSWITQNEHLIFESLHEDLHKSERESLFTEILAILNELDYFIKNVDKLSERKRVKTPLFLLPASSYLYCEPLGQVLVISPWNFPYMLSLIPLIGAVAAGNCVILKPSEFSVRSSLTMERMISECFQEEHVRVVQGGPQSTQSLLEHRWGHVFFTGSCAVGKIIAERSGAKLTPVTLELGGKSPVVVTQKSNLKMAARRIIFGKSLNAGQTCVAPDYVLVESSQRDALVSYLIKEINRQFGELTVGHPGYGKIINQKHFDRLVRLLDQAEVIHGGQSDREKRFIDLTIMGPPRKGSILATEEIFGPLLPIISFEKIEEAISHIKQGNKPLAAYIFSENQSEIDFFLSELSFGGGCVNDTIVHPSNSNLKFGGVGNSGIGSYHGHQSFVTFSHMKPIVRSSTLVDPSIRYLPESSWKTRLVRFLMRL